jgi:MATE family multidrug resistance protein
MISNVLIPMLGMIDIAIAGNIGEDTDIAALAIGTTIFNFIYWNCSFLRMGTSGITAQAVGAGNRRECSNMLVRSFWMACVIAALLLALQQPLGRLSLAAMQGSSAVQALAAEYFFARIWAVPASVTLFAIQGWFIGMQDARTPMTVAIVSVAVNAIFSLFFVYRLDMGIAGIAWGTVVAQYAGLALSCVFLFTKYRDCVRTFDVRESLRVEPVLRFMAVNRDIFLRTACVVSVYTFFTAASARFGDTVLATNALLMQLFTLFSYMSDGFAYAAESLSGKAVGARDVASFRRYTRHLLAWAAIIAIFFVAVYILAWKQILTIFSPSEEVIRCAGQYVGWVIAVPLLGCIPFMLDGIMIGATRTKILRNTVFCATVAFFGSFYALSPRLENTALWVSFIVFLTLRGVLLYFCSGRINAERIVGK